MRTSNVLIACTTLGTNVLALRFSTNTLKCSCASFISALKIYSNRSNQNVILYSKTTTSESRSHQCFKILLKYSAAFIVKT